MRVFELIVIGLSSWIILGGDAISQTLWPKTFWQVRVAELEGYARHCLWHLKSIEWELMKGRLELSIGISEAEDKAECLGMDSSFCISGAREKSLLKIKNLLGQEAKAKAAYERTLEQLSSAKHSFSQS